jgi:hypothetical protein
MQVPDGAGPGVRLLHPTVSTPTSHRCRVWMRGALVPTGRQTRTTRVRTVPPWATGPLATSPRGLSQRRWSAWGRARLVIPWLLAHGVPPGPGRRAGDDPGAARPGPQVLGKARPRAGVRSPPSATASRWGHQGGVVAGLVTCPCAVRPWARPVVGAWSHAPAGAQAQGTRPHPPAPLARRRLARLGRGLPAPPLSGVGDRGDGTREPARCGRTHARPLPVVSTGEGEAAVDEPPPRARGLRGDAPAGRASHSPPRLPGAWAGGRPRDLEGITGPGHGSRIGADLGERRWGHGHEGPGTPRAAEVLTPAMRRRPQQRVAGDPHRWSLATTCQAGRASRPRASPHGDGPHTG